MQILLMGLEFSSIKAYAPAVDYLINKQNTT